MTDVSNIQVYDVNMYEVVWCRHFLSLAKSSHDSVSCQPQASFWCGAFLEIWKSTNFAHPQATLARASLSADVARRKLSRGSQSRNVCPLRSPHLPLPPISLPPSRACSCSMRQGRQQSTTIPSKSWNGRLVVYNTSRALARFGEGGSDGERKRTLLLCVVYLQSACMQPYPWKPEVPADPQDPLPSFGVKQADNSPLDFGPYSRKEVTLSTKSWPGLRPAPPPSEVITLFVNDVNGIKVPISCTLSDKVEAVRKRIFQKMQAQCKVGN